MKSTGVRMGKHEEKANDEIYKLQKKVKGLETKLKFSHSTLLKSRVDLETIHKRYNLIVNGAKDIIWEWNLREQKVFLSARWKEVTGYKEDMYDIPYDNWLSMVHDEDADFIKSKFKQVIDGKFKGLMAECRMKLRDDSYGWFLFRGASECDSNGVPTRIGGSITDITEQKRMEQQIVYLSNYDSVTGLPNRKLLIDKLESAIAQSKVSARKGAVLFVDLDNFRKLSDSYGFVVGNDLLKTIGEKLKECVRDSDIVSRTDGDEFIVLLQEVKGKSDAVNVAERILKGFRIPFSCLGREFYITASIGIILFPESCDNVFDILKNGVSAVHWAKKLGKNQYQFYEKEVNDKLIQRIDMENKLRQALDKNEFLLYYQPQVEISTGKILGLEALIRWNSPGRGLVPPLEFIQIAEEIDLITPIGNWVLDSICAQNKYWQEMGYSNYTVAANISARQLQQKNFVEVVKTVLEKSQLESRYLELEITESALLESMDTAVQSLKQLKDMGVKISLDDFGTAYSSLNYVRCLPIDKIKIDKSFIRDINRNPSIEAIISAITVLSNKMNLEIVAEGVETVEQLNFLIEQGCTQVQGYLFSKPVPVVQAEDLIKKKQITPEGQFGLYYQI